jgi:hypothetical protein
LLLLINAQPQRAVVETHGGASNHLHTSQLLHVNAQCYNSTATCPISHNFSAPDQDTNEKQRTNTNAITAAG